MLLGSASEQARNPRRGGSCTSTQPNCSSVQNQVSKGGFACNRRRRPGMQGFRASAGRQQWNRKGPPCAADLLERKVDAGTVCLECEGSAHCDVGCKEQRA